MNRRYTAIQAGCLTAAYLLALLCLAAPGSPSRILKARIVGDQVESGKTSCDRLRRKHPFSTWLSSFGGGQIGLRLHIWPSQISSMSAAYTRAVAISFAG